ncbi:MAG: hypothetical protein HRU15_02200, partial [Planctomycetes bacterium]|nr:hypothetical protein [Planctomycetota bacterium]
LYLKKKAQAILDRVVGAGKSLVTISVDLDFTERSESATIVDAKNRVAVSETTTSSEESTPIPLSGGVAGTASNVEEAGLNTSKSSEPATKTLDDNATKYHVGQRLTTVREDVGHIRGMAVSIVLDYKVKVGKEDVKDSGDAEDADAAENGKTVERIPYSAEERAQIEKSVLNAIGFYTAKDYQSVTEPGTGEQRFIFSTECINMATPEIEDETALASVALISEDMMESIRYAVAIIVAFALIMIARGQLKRSHSAWEADRLQAEKDKAKVETNKEEESTDRLFEKRMEVKDAIRKQINDNPNAAAEVLKMWIYDG